MELRNKNVAVLGFGKEGQAMVPYLLGRGARVTVCDEREPQELGDLYTALQGQHVQWRLGPSYLKNLEEFSVIVRSPGVPFRLPVLKKVKAKGAVVTSLTKIFFEECPAPIIGITGTKGKGTTSTLIAEILKKDRRTVHLLGNIGVPAIAALPKIKKNDIVVYELSSFQLQDLTISPHIAVMLGLTVDHQDYHRSPQEYYQAKANIFLHQKPTDAVVFNSDYIETRQLLQLAKGRRFETSREHLVENGAYLENGSVIRQMFGKKEVVLEAKEVALKGEHNLENVMPAVVASTLVGATLQSQRAVVKKFAGLPHRLELVATINRVQYWNNSYGTTPETAAAAIRAFTEPKILLVGGSDKGLPFQSLAREIAASNVKAIVGIGLVAPRIYAEVKKAAATLKRQAPAYVECRTTMLEMLAVARKFAKPGDVVLLAPGAASFDLFKNATERGEQFRAAVFALKPRTSVPK